MKQIIKHYPMTDRLIAIVIREFMLFQLRKFFFWCNKNRVILFLQAVNLIFIFYYFCIWLRSEYGKSECYFLLCPAKLYFSSRIKV